MERTVKEKVGEMRGRKRRCMSRDVDEKVGRY
jgi:hypothetical protein